MGANGAAAVKGAGGGRVDAAAATTAAGSGPYYRTVPTSVIQPKVG